MQKLGVVSLKVVEVVHVGDAFTNAVGARCVVVYSMKFAV